MRRTLVVVAAVVLAVFLLDAAGWVGRPGLALERIAPAADGTVIMRTSVRPGEVVMLTPGTGEALLVELSTRGASHGGTLEVEGRGGAVYLDHRERLTLGPERPGCTGSAIRWQCSALLRTSRPDAERLLLSAVDTSVSILHVDYRSLTGKRMPAASRDLVIAALAFLVLAAPLFRALRSRVATAECLLIVLGALFLAAAGVMSLVAVSGLLAIGFVGVRALGSAGDRRRQHRTVMLLLVVVVVYFAKVVLPLLPSGGILDGYAISLPLALSYIAIRLVDLAITADSPATAGMTLREYLAFMLFPATLAAGPIMTLDQFRRARVDGDALVDFAQGTCRFLVGLAKKAAADLWLGALARSQLDLVISDPAGAHAASVFAMLAVTLAYVYLDFSAYSDMAIGSARCCGWRLPENFDWPLLRAGVRSYWRHWHISLSSWTMRRVYFPVFLGTRSAALANFCAMLLIGVWHAPQSTWVLWAAHHAAGLMLETALARRAAPRLQRIEGPARYVVSASAMALGIAFTWLWVSLGHVFTVFNDPSLALALYWRVLSAPFAGCP